MSESSPASLLGTVRLLVIVSLAAGLVLQFMASRQQRDALELLRAENRLLESENRLLSQQLEAERILAAAQARRSAPVPAVPVSSAP